MTTAYTNQGGQGDRRAFITVTTTATWLHAPLSTIINGTHTGESWIFDGQSGREILFDFGAGNAPIIDEFTWYQDSAHTQGTWTFRGSSDNSTWTNLSTGLNLGGALAADVHAFSNSTGFRYYSLLQTAGTTSNNPYTEEIEFKIDGLNVLALEGVASNTFSTAASGTVTLSSEHDDAIIVVLVHTQKDTASTYRPVSSISDVAGLTWNQRKQLQWAAGRHTNGNTAEIWWAHAPTKLTGDVITVNVSGGNVDTASIAAFACHGCNLSAPFDTHSSLPATATDVTGSSTEPTVTGISTTNANCILLGWWSSPSALQVSGNLPATGWTEIATVNNAGGDDWSTQESEDKPVTAAQSSVSVAFGATQRAINWGMIVDALTVPATPVTGTWGSTEAADAMASTGIGDIFPDTTIILPGEGAAEPTTLTKAGVSVSMLLPGGDTYIPPPPPSGTSGAWASTGTTDAFAALGGVLGGSWHSSEADDALAFMGHPELVGIWESIESSDELAFASPPQGSWDSTEPDDVMTFAGGVLGGQWNSTETKDAWASDVIFPPFGSLAATDIADLMSSTGIVPPHGTWESTEGADRSAITGDVLATFFDPTTASWGIDFQKLDLTVINQLAFGQTAGAKSNTTRTTGKYYAEFTTRFSANNSGVGIGNALATFDGWGNGTAVGPGNGPAASGAGCFSYSNGTIWIDGVQQSNWSGRDSLYNAVVRVAIDLDNNLIWFSVNGGFWNGIAGANPALGVASPRPPSNQPQEVSGGYDISAITAHGPIYLWAELVNAYDTATLNPGNSAFGYSVPSGFASWDVAPPINIPVQLDGYATNGITGGGGGVTSGAVTLSTTQDNDVIVLGISTGGYWNASTVDHITSSSGLVWKRRNKRWRNGGYKNNQGGTVISSGLDTEVWWAHAPVALNGEVITVHTTSATGGMALVAFGVSGANYTTPWDPHTLAGGYVDGIGNLYYFPPTASLYTNAKNAFLFGFHSDTGSDSGVTQAPWTYVTSALGGENQGYGDFLSLVYQVVEEPQLNTNVVSGITVAGVGNCYTAQSMMFDSIVATDEIGVAHEIVWFWDPNSVSNSIQLSTGRTLQLSYSAANFNLMVLIEVAIMSASGTGTVSSISESQGSLSSAGFERRSRTVTSTPLGPLAVEIWWGWMPMYTNAERPNNDTITINTANTAAGDIIGATILGLGGTTGAFGLGDPFWDVDPTVPSKNSNTSGSPPPYATDISTTIPSDLVVAWTANNSANVPGFTNPFVTLVQHYPNTIAPVMQLNSVAPPLYTGFEFYYEPGLVTSETAEFLQTPEPNGWIVIADAIPVGPPQPPSGTMHISDQQDKFTHTGDYSTIGIASPGGWVGLLPLYATMAATDREDICGGTPNLGYSPFLGEGWLGWVPAHAAWNSTEGYDTMDAYGWVLGFGITGQIGATETKDRMAFSNRATVTGTMSAVGAKDRWASAGLVLPAAHVRPKIPVKRQLLIIT